MEIASEVLTNSVNSLPENQKKSDWWLMVTEIRVISGTLNFWFHIIGFGLVDEDTEQLQCAASAGEGQYFPATDALDLGTVLNEATTATIDKPKSNASVYAVKNGKPIDAFVEA